MGLLFVFLSIFVYLFYVFCFRNLLSEKKTFLKVSLLLLFFILSLQVFSFYSFFSYKIKESERLKYELTIMRIETLSEFLEDYCSKYNEYPHAEGVGELEVFLKNKNMLLPSLKDGWGDDLILRSFEWDYMISAKKRDGLGSFPIIYAKNKKEVYPLTISSEEISKFLLR